MVGHRVADHADDFGLIEPIVLRGVGLGGLEPRQKLIGVARIVANHLAQNPGDGAGGEGLALLAETRAYVVVVKLAAFMLL